MLVAVFFIQPHYTFPMNHLKHILIAVLSLLCLNAYAQDEDQLPAFPGAEGYGMYTTGGRGGKVFHVTTLEDNNAEGSLRYALTASADKRVIVFDVDGIIHLKEQLKISKSNITIAGQTAPGDGICIADFPVVLASNNIIIRYVRFRLGNLHVDKHEGDGLGGMDKKNIIIDHCSISWSVDECCSVYGNTNSTVQWCMVDQSMVNCGHSKGAHGYGGNWGGSGASYHHNLMAHHVSRVPRLGPRPGTQQDERMDMRCNVFYNWNGEGCYGGEGMNVDIVNNYYKPGPATKSKVAGRIAKIGVRTSSYTKHDTANPNDWDKMWHVWGTFYVTGNVNPSKPEVTADNWNHGIWDQNQNSNDNDRTWEENKLNLKRDTPLATPYTTTHTAEVAYEKVLLYAGASLHRDSHDAYIVDDVRQGIATYTGQKLDPGFVNSQDDAGGWPELSAGDPARCIDSDGDGMPDWYEEANGLNPADNDGQLYADNGYTHLENYLNSLVADITEAQNRDASSSDIPAITHYDRSQSSRYDLYGRRLGNGTYSTTVEIINGKKVIYQTK